MRSNIADHGSPFDRGCADSYYHRPKDPHKNGVGGGTGPRVDHLSREEVFFYNMGYEWNEQFGDKKSWD
jgi:hypothetical protein